MSVKLRIDITKDLLNRAKDCKATLPGGFSKNCAIALGIIDVLPDACVNELDGINFVKKEEGHEVYYAHSGLPIEAQDFIDSFDSLPPEERVKMEPFSFEIEVPDEVVNRISLDELKESLINHPTLSLV